MPKLTVVSTPYPPTTHIQIWFMGSVFKKLQTVKTLQFYSNDGETEDNGGSRTVVFKVSELSFSDCCFTGIYLHTWNQFDGAEYLAQIVCFTISSERVPLKITTIMPLEIHKPLLTRKTYKKVQ